MRITRSLQVLGAALVPSLLTAQDVKVGITTSNSDTIWYTDPMWLWIGAGVVLLIIVLAVMASRKTSTKRTTTVIR